MANTSPRVSRRNLLRAAGGCAAMTNTSLLSTIFSLSATNTAVAATEYEGYKALVCLFLFGGNDSFNMLSPTTPTERAAYLQARGGVFGQAPNALGLDEANLHSITDTPSGRTFGIHPAMPELQTLYNQDKLTFVCNVGSLVRPTTKADYLSQSNLPLGLFSHADHQRHWMTSVPDTRANVTGWAGRMADLVTGPTNTNENSIAMCISLNNVNMLQTGGSVVPYVVTDGGAQQVDWYGPTWTQADIFTTLTDDVLSKAYGNLVERTFAQSNRNALDAAIAFNDATEAVTSVNAFFPDENDENTPNPTQLQKQLRLVARAIGAQQTLKQTRQIFFVGHFGYDNHDELINNQHSNLTEVSQALKNFYDALAHLGRNNDVVTFSASDFARTLNSNGLGSDHAWGGIQLVMGDAVSGGRLHGTYPESLAPGNPLDTGRGRLIPTTSVDEMAAELAMWYGIANDNTLETIPSQHSQLPVRRLGHTPHRLLELSLAGAPQRKRSRGGAKRPDRRTDQLVQQIVAQPFSAARRDQRTKRAWVGGSVEKVPASICGDDRRPAFGLATGLKARVRANLSVHIAERQLTGFDPCSRGDQWRRLHEQNRLRWLVGNFIRTQWPGTRKQRPIPDDHVVGRLEIAAALHRVGMHVNRRHFIGERHVLRIIPRLRQIKPVVQFFLTEVFENQHPPGMQRTLRILRIVRHRRRIGPMVFGILSHRLGNLLQVANRRNLSPIVGELGHRTAAETDNGEHQTADQDQRHHRRDRPSNGRCVGIGRRRASRTRLDRSAKKSGDLNGTAARDAFAGLTAISILDFRLRLTMGAGE